MPVRSGRNAPIRNISIGSSPSGARTLTHTLHTLWLAAAVLFCCHTYTVSAIPYLDIGKGDIVAWNENVSIAIGGSDALAWWCDKHTPAICPQDLVLMLSIDLHGSSSTLTRSLRMIILSQWRASISMMLPKTTV